MKFNKIKLIAGLCLALGVSALGQNNVGTLVTDPIRPFSVSSTHPSAIANEIKGGPFSSSNLVGLSNIPAPRLEIGAIGHATNTGLYYRLTATNPATWSSINGANITNIAASNVVGALATNGNAAGLTNLTAANITGTVGLASNVTGTVAISNGGTGATNAAGARTNLGLGWTALTNTNSATSLMGLVLDVGTTNEFLVTGASNPSNFIIFTNPVVLSGGAQGLRISDGTNEAWDFPSDAEAEFYYSFGFYGTNASNNAAMTRTNLGLPLPALTNVSNSTFNTAIGLGTTNNVQFNTVRVAGTGSPTNLGILLGGSNALAPNQFNGLWGSAGPPSVGVGINGTTRLFVSETVITASAPIGFDNTTNAATTRTNLGLGWSGLTNTIGTGLVAVNTNGEVVSPTNFWQVAPIVTRFVEFDPPTNATTNIVAARNLHIHSLAISRTGVTSTIALPTNNVFNGDIALVVHQGPTSSVTAVRTAGAGTNLITLNQFDEAVEFVYYNNVWQFNHNRSFIEPIYFSGTNASANAAASRTNLGLGNISMGSNSIVVTTNFTATNGEAKFTNLQTDYLEFKTLFIGDSTNTNVIVWEIPTQRTNFLHNLGLGPTNSVAFADATIGNDTYINSAGIRWGGNDRIQLEEMKLQGGSWEVDGGSFSVAGSFDIVGETNKAITRTNLGLGGTNNVTFNDVTASGTLTATSTVTARTNLVVEGFVDFTTNRTNSNPATNNQINDFIEIRIGTNQFWLPVYK